MAIVDLINISSENIEISYQDDGKFTGDKNKLGKLFYTNHSSRGSGIGLYLIQKLMIAMKGKATINPSENFEVILSFNVHGES